MDRYLHGRVDILFNFRRTQRAYFCVSTMTMEDYINSSRPAFQTAVNAINREDKEALTHLTNQALNILYSPRERTGIRFCQVYAIYRGKLKTLQEMMTYQIY